ncbi:hypothetical protein PsorP6_007962 [Peronosclerospora sorghi]|uniref:Uncharacterized protein n=1 Tax=Peronosclerospora sorghi TaxID=230839 RepID=A0ACC0W8E7_9STRA|nr:hypothetical protein PsorP6_007962 [Peronosclerospora sorghi]
MHHEVFVALLGHTGDVIERRVDGFFVRPDASFLSHAQCHVLNRVVRLGYEYVHLKEFVQQAPTLASSYVHALAHGVDKVLHRYVEAIVHLEAKTVRARSVLPLSSLMYELDEFLEVLPQVTHLIDQVTTHLSNATSPCPGVHLLSLVHQATNSGFPRVRTIMHELLYCCHRVLYHQMLAWMLHGDLVDPYKEFFIKQVSPEPRGRDETNLLWHDHFHVDMQAVPLDYFPLAVADHIFVIGKSVHLLTHTNHFSPRDVQELVEIMSTLAQRPVFDAVAVAVQVENVRRHVARKLHAHVVVQADFVGYLRAFKNFFLLARGDVFQTLIERTVDHMQRPPTLQSQEDVTNRIWHDIVRTLVPAHDRWRDDFYLELPLQTFRRPTFASTNGFVLCQASRSEQGTFLVSTSQAASSTVWWQHVQIGDTCFSSDFSLEWEQRAFRTGSHRVALLLQSEPSCFRAANFVDGSFQLDQPAHYVGMELVIEHVPSTANQVRVMAHVLPACVRESDHVQWVEVSMKETRCTSRCLMVRILYARQAVSSTETKHVTYKKRMLVMVNDVVVFETSMDLSQVLHLHASGGEWLLGLAFTSFVRLASWTLGKYKSCRRDTQCIEFPDEQRVRARELWSALSLRTTVRGPLQWLVTPDVLRVYGRLFRFGLELKRVACGLDRAWQCPALRSKARANTWSVTAGALLNRMSVVVRTVTLYFHVVVMDCTYEQCLTELEHVKEWERAKRVHETCVARMATQCFVHTRTLSSALDDVVKCCWDFTEWVQALPRTHEDEGMRGLTTIRDAFQARFECLVRHLEYAEARELLVLFATDGSVATERACRQARSRPLHY